MPPARKGAAPWFLVAAGTITAVAGLLRLLAARGDLWLDELWSMELARMAGSTIGVLDSLHHDNNHYLNTLWLLAVGPDATPVVARLLSVAAGTAMVAVAVAQTASRSRSLALTWGTLLAVSDFTVHYGSEARGYALAMLLAVACMGILERLLDGRRGAWPAGFAACATLGLLSHLTFLYALLAFLAWAGVAVARGPGARRLAVPLAVAFVPPIAALTALWVVDLRHVAVGGGPSYRVLDVLRELVRVTFGTPTGPLEVLGIGALALCAAQLVRVARAGDARWVFLVTVTLLGPAAVLLLTRPVYLAPRYFGVEVPFLLWLAAAAVVDLARRGRVAAFASAGLVTLFLAGNGGHLARLLQDGRGHYAEAMRFIAGASRGRTTVGSDNDFRNGVVFDRYLPPANGLVHLSYVPIGEWNFAQPTWVLVHRFAEDPIPEPFIFGPTGHRYVLVRIFPYSSLSGWDWYVYRLDPGAGAP